MPKPTKILMAWNTRDIPQRFLHENELQLFRRGFDTADIALARSCSEATIYSMIHYLRGHEIQSRLAG